MKLLKPKQLEGFMCQVPSSYQRWKTRRMKKTRKNHIWFIHPCTLNETKGDLPRVHAPCAHNLVSHMLMLKKQFFVVFGPCLQGKKSMRPCMHNAKIDYLRVNFTHNYSFIILTAYMLRGVIRATNVVWLSFYWYIL